MSDKIEEALINRLHELDSNAINPIYISPLNLITYRKDGKCFALIMKNYCHCGLSDCVGEAITMIKKLEIIEITSNEKSDKFIANAWQKILYCNYEDNFDYYGSDFYVLKRDIVGYFDQVYMDTYIDFNKYGEIDIFEKLNSMDEIKKLFDSLASNIYFV